MRPSSMLTLGVAVLFGLMAVGAARSYLDQQRSLYANGENQPRQASTMVVAAEPLRFGARIEPDKLRTIDWAAEELPEGAYGSIAELLPGDTDAPRYARGAFSAGEPIIDSRITAPGERPTLSTAVAEGKRAVTIRVNDVLGVAGFVLPGDRVDVLLTRTRGSGEPYVDVLLQGMKVLAIDQVADESTDRPNVAQSVTFEADPEEAQKLALGTQIGQVSLALRNVAQETLDQVRRISVADLGTIEPAPEPEPQPEVAEIEAPAPEPEVRRGRTVGVYRGLNRTEYRLD